MPVESKTKVSEDIIFPILARNIHHPKDQPLIVLFTSENEGVVIVDKSEKRPRKIGSHSKQWGSVNSEHWVLLPKGTEITITQN